LLEGLRQRGLLDRTAVVLTGDVGLALGEHGVVGAASAPHTETAHLPLIVRLPRAAFAGRRVSALTQAVDLVPTLADLLGHPLSEVQGRSLLPLLRGEADAVRGYAVSAAGEWALRTAEWAFLLPIQGGEPRLYVKPDDRWEINDVRQHHPELVEHLEQVLRGFVEAAARPGPLAAPELRDVEAEAAAE
jgi:arylsulfatase A-like enzyme